MNKVTLIGRIGQNVEAKQVNNQSVASFSLATSEKYTTKDGEKKELTEWHNCSLWGPRADKLAPYLTKGKQVAVTGSIHYRKVEKEGMTGHYADIRVDDLEFLSSGEAKPQQPQQVAVGHVNYPVSEQPFHRPQPQPQQDTDDLPF